MTGPGDPPWWHSDAEGPTQPGEPTEGFHGAGRPWEGIDPHAQAAQVLGTVAQEAGRFLLALQERLAVPDGPAIATGSAECQVCPVCRAIAVLRTVDPDAVERLTAAAAHLVSSMQPSGPAAGEDVGQDMGEGEDRGDDAAEAAEPGASPSSRPRTTGATRPRTTKPTRPRAPKPPASKVERIPLDDE